jgi:hypothetical protein
VAVVIGLLLYQGLAGDARDLDMEFRRRRIAAAHHGFRVRR